MRYGLVLQALEGHEGSSSEDEDAAGQHSQGPTYVQEQQQLRQAFLQVLLQPEQNALLASIGASDTPRFLAGVSLKVAADVLRVPTRAACLTCTPGRKQNPRDPPCRGHTIHSICRVHEHHNGSLAVNVQESQGDGFNALMLRVHP